MDGKTFLKTIIQFATAVDRNKYFKQIKLAISFYTCKPFSDVHQIPWCLYKVRITFSHVLRFICQHFLTSYPKNIEFGLISIIQKIIKVLTSREKNNSFYLEFIQKSCLGGEKGGFLDLFIPGVRIKKSCFFCWSLRG